MPTQDVTGSYLPLGINHGNQFFVKAIVGSAMASSDTINISCPDGAPVDALPLSLMVFTTSDSVTYTLNANLAVTNHNVSTGVTVCTASGVVAKDAIIILAFDCVL